MRILSIDLEDWFHILDHPETAGAEQWKNFPARLEANTERLLKILASKNQKATWFCLGWIADHYPELIRRIAENHEIAAHSDQHQLVYTQNRQSFRIDTIAVKHKLEDIIGKEVSIYRAAGFSITPSCSWAFEELLDCGFRTDCSVFPFARNHGGFPGFPSTGPCRLMINGKYLQEFPMSSGKIFGKHIVYSGGGYFRLFPYRWIRSMMKEQSYVMTYFHPRDFDPEQPVLKSLSFKRKWMSYTGLKTAQHKLERLLDDFSFTDIGTAVQETNWEERPVLQL